MVLQQLGYLESPWRVLSDSVSHHKVPLLQLPRLDELPCILIAQAQTHLLASLVQYLLRDISYVRSPCTNKNITNSKIETKRLQDHIFQKTYLLHPIVPLVVAQDLHHSFHPFSHMDNH